MVWLGVTIPSRATMHELLHGVFKILSSSSTNSTCPAFVTGDTVCLPPIEIPFYFSLRQNIFDGIPDTYVALAAPVLTFWLMSLVFHCLDISRWRWLDKYRIHESEEVESRNLATPWEIGRAIIFQNVMQTLVGLAWLTESPEISVIRCQSEMEGLGRTLVFVVRYLLGEETGIKILELQGAQMTHWLYWWGIPAAQILFALFILDTWQYFLHRLMHTNQYLYKKIHSVHHKICAPYAFGAFYSHPLEGFLLDTLGIAIAERVACLSIRQTIFFFIYGTGKGVDDHCGYSFPFDPFQLISGNNSDYHDIHHQAIGIKSNFSQPFFVHWDVLLGTRMTRKDIQERREKLKTT
ncbi:fatty acid hydroxylase superfamily-domain-containing protein [Suillus clintonianus]|uniref:fatty acid hydroxylase superfamily-domain-containing protein n=1 Tax=Suillus clintonianus TaxID=1904413 RepID=UPI001B8689B5|nr:fatty acid hydroxylase superfamily-domain-containing protein [Suillus clintonianus]KAG2141300.1 fatty acid hydroxylase superfamily-domain-containing protein [Suillus clintonianus]